MDRLQKMKEQGRRLPLDDIIGILQANFNRVPNIFVILDALDEYFSEEVRHNLLQHLRSFTSVRIMITSRPLPSIENALNGVSRLILRASAKDIGSHFQVRVQRNPTLAKLISKASFTDVERKVIEKADGM
jgi:exopolysaccharide biosynthesis predicted pyruvyltransferase EpsI